MNTGYLHSIPNCKFGIEYEVSDMFLCYFFASNKHQKITKLLKRENFEPTKYPREKTGTHKIPTRKNLGPMKYPREKIGNPRTTH